MTSEQAIEAALAARERFGIDAEFVADSIEERFIEVVNGNPVKGRPMKPGAVRDVRAWIVMLVNEGEFVEIALDDATGKPVRVLRSR